MLLVSMLGVESFVFSFTSKLKHLQELKKMIISVFFFLIFALEN